MQAGERVAVDAGKQDPLDFVLWKSAKPTEPEEAKWNAEFGQGRPGWHIECSAMSESLLGKTFDIHGGGADLQFPHHENEIAQSEGANGQTFVNTWMHNGFVRVETNGVSEKMSKSLNNFFTIRDILNVYDPEVVRFFILRAQYRSPLNYSDAHLDDAKQSLTRFYTALKQTPASNTTTVIDWSDPTAHKFAAAMNDDFNTPEAVAVLFELATEVNKGHDPQRAQLLKMLAGTLGLLQGDPDAFLKGQPSAHDGLTEDMILKQIEARQEAKKAKNFALSDQIRSELLAQGVVLEDRPGGVTEWRRA